LRKHHQKKRDLKLNIFLQSEPKSSLVFRGLEQLSSLIWRRVMAIYKLGVIQTRFPFVGVEIVTTFSFLCHHFASRYAGKPIKGSKGSNDSLISNKKLSAWIGVQSRIN